MKVLMNYEELLDLYGLPDEVTARIAFQNQSVEFFVQFIRLFALVDAENHEYESRRCRMERANIIGVIQGSRDSVDNRF